MKSRTSFFNATVLRKDITRFAPLWGLYTIFLIILFLTGQREDPTLTANAITNTLGEMALFNLIYGGLCANILFSDLFQSRMCNALHTMPLRREGWFLTHCISGLLFSVVPSLVGAVFLMFLLQQFYYMALIWLLVTVLQFLFFFGLGIFSTMCAGNRLGMAAVYMIINLFSLLVYVLAKKVYEPLLYGIELVQDPFQFFSPVAHLTANELLYFNYDYLNGHFVNGHIAEFYPKVWLYLFVVAAMGVVLMLLAMLLYRKRKMECAGDFVAFRGIAPLFLLICSLGCGVFLYTLSSVFGFAVDYVLMAIGVVVGFFAGSMLLERKVQVFSGKNFLRFAVLAVTLVASLFLTKMDPLRITWYVPETEDIAAMRVYQDMQMGQYKYMDVECYQFETPQQIDTFRNVHKTLMAERGEKTDGMSHIYVHYKLKNGREVIRYYAIDEYTAAYDTLKTHFSDYRYLFNCHSWDELSNGAFTMLTLNLFDKYIEQDPTLPAAIELNDLEIEDQDKIDRFLEALRKDCDAGNMAQSYTFHVGEESVAWCYLSSNLRNDEGIIIANGERFRELSIYGSSTHIKALIDQWIAEYQTQQ